ncbi:YcxB family protein [Candidatus Leptofilum sp.]|uniref:YcxB family protein n=1 Tax=Candidatus Leptofilum sp. TaxID=3241576 RepID=UPI003B5A679D
MEITTNHSRLDHFLIQLHLIPRSKAVWLSGLFLWAFMFFLTLSARELSGDNVCVFCTVLSVGIVSLIPTTIIMLVLISLGLIIPVLSIGLIPGILGEHEFILKDDGLFERTAVNETLTKWKGIMYAKRYKKFLLIRVGSSFYYLPRRCFESQEQYEEFWEQLYDNWQEKK